MQIIVILYMLAKLQAVPVRQTLQIQGLAIDLSRQMAGKCLKLDHNRMFLSDTLYASSYFQLHALQSEVSLKKPKRQIMRDMQNLHLKSYIQMLFATRYQT